MDRFSICEAFAALESDYNSGGWLQERPSNQRRREAVSVQLARMRFKPRPSLGGFSSLDQEAREIYMRHVLLWGLPNPKGSGRICRLVQGPEGSPNFCFGLHDAFTGEGILFVQTDWDYPSLASLFGYVPCECGHTDGTVDCKHKTASEMIAAAFDWLERHEGELVEAGDYDCAE